MKRRSTQEFFSKKCTYQVENPLQIKSTSIRRTVDSRSRVEWKSEFNFLVMSNVGLSLAMTSTKKGHTTSSCILSEVTVLRNKRSENFFSQERISHVLTYLWIFLVICLFIHFIAMIKTPVCHIVVVLLTYSCHSYLHTSSWQGLCMYSYNWLTGVMFARDFGPIMLGWRNCKKVFSFGNAFIFLLH